VRKLVAISTVSLLVVTVATLAANLAVSGAGQHGNLYRRINPITAVFVPALRETQYSFHLSHYDMSLTYAEPTSVEWSLHLELVDKSGAPNPGTAGSGAAVDYGCNNAGVGIPESEKMAVKPSQSSWTFVWHHPDAVDSVPTGRYHCNHLDMGPRGHQGLVSVVVRGKGWECTESYKGTNSSTAQGEAETIRGVVKDVTASYPDCFSVR
jgi:hypothetical protein